MDKYKMQCSIKNKYTWFHLQHYINNSSLQTWPNDFAKSITGIKKKDTMIMIEETKNTSLKKKRKKKSDKPAYLT